MHRLDRHRLILQGKRDGAFDANQYYFEHAERTRVTRRARVLLRGGTPVVITTPRWSGTALFLDDLASDLALGEPVIKARPLGLHALKGLTVHQAWGWIASAIAEFCQVTLVEGDLAGRPIWQAVSRMGFREVISGVLERAEGGSKRCLMVHGLEHAHVEAVHDLFEVFSQHIERFGDDRDVNMVFAGSRDAPYLELPGAPLVHLADYSDAEAKAALVEQLGPRPEPLLTRVVAQVGGVPEILAAIGENPEGILQEIAASPDHLWKAMGSVGGEIRMALDIVRADPKLSSRIERIAKQESLPMVPLDEKLEKSGLVTVIRQDRGNRTALRTPWFRDLVLEG